MDHIDIALDSILRASGSALRNYTMHKTINAMRDAMKAALQERQDVIDALLTRVNTLEDENGDLLKDLDATTSRGT